MLQVEGEAQTPEHICICVSDIAVLHNQVLRLEFDALLLGLPRCIGHDIFKFPFEDCGHPTFATGGIGKFCMSERVGLATIGSRMWNFSMSGEWLREDSHSRSINLLTVQDGEILHGCLCRKIH